ncbi:MAG TPA: FHA domain-containing protein [Candidatus Obscuribacterales bacterium]
MRGLPDGEEHRGDRTGRKAAEVLDQDLSRGDVKADVKGSPRDATTRAVKTIVDELSLVDADGSVVLKALQGKSKAEVKAISDAYEEQTGRKLADDIKKAQGWAQKQNEVDSSKDFGKALDILQGTRTGDKQGDREPARKAARAIVEELSLVEADGGVVLKALEGKSKAEIKAIADIYEKETGRKLEDDIKKAQGWAKQQNEVDSSENFGKALALIAGARRAEGHARPVEAPAKPQDAAEKRPEAPAKPGDLPPKRAEAPPEQPPKPVDAEAMKKAADDLYQATEGMVGTDEEAIYRILAGKSEAELKALDAEFRKRSDQGFSIEQVLRDEMDGLELQRALYFLSHKDTDVVKLPEGVDRPKLEAANEELYKATRRDETFGETPEGWGTDEKAIFKVLEGKTPDELKAMDLLFKERYGCSLEDILKDELSGAELTRALDLLHGVKLTDHADGSQSKEYPDKTRVEVGADGRVKEVVDANGERRSFQYQGEELSQIKGRLGTWTRSMVDDQGNSTWTSDRGHVWKGEFSVDSDGNLHFVPREGQGWIFTRDGRDVPADSPEGRAIKPPSMDIEIGPAVVEGVGEEKGKVDIEIGPAVVEKVGEEKGKVDVEIGQAVVEKVGEGDKPAAPAEAKVAEKPAPAGDAKPAEAPLTPDQQKAAIEAASDLAVKMLNPFHKVTLEDVQEALYGKSEAELREIQAAFKRVGLDLEEHLRKELDGVDLATALEMLRHTDADVVSIPDGVDRTHATKVAEVVHSLAGVELGGAMIEGTLKALNPDQIKAVNDLFKSMYGIELADYLKDQLSASAFEAISKMLPKETAAEAPAETKPLTPDQQKAAFDVAGSLVAKSMNPWLGLNLEDVQKALHGKSEAEIKAIKDACKSVGVDLEETLREHLDGAELGKALELLRRKDADAVWLPEGVDRVAVTKVADKIHDKLGEPGANVEIARDLAKMKPEEIQALVALYKDKYGIDLADDLKDRLPAGTFGEIGKLLPQTKEYPDGSVEVVQGKVTVAEVAVEEKGEVVFNRREFKYNEKGELSEVTSTFTGHTWKRTVVDGKEAWVNEKGKVWKGTFNVDADGNLSFTPHGGTTAFLFTRDGKMHRVPAEAVAKAAGPADAKAAEKPAAAADAKAAEKPAAAADAKAAEKPAAAADAKAAEKPAAAADAKAAEKPAPAGDAKAAEKPLTPEQQKDAIEAASGLAAKMLNPFHKVTLEDVQEALYGKSEAELREIQAAFKRVGLDLEEHLRKELDGVELAKALEMLRHKDADVVPIPEGVNREAATKAAELIHGLADGWMGGPMVAGVLKGLKPDELKAVRDLYKDMYGIDLADHLKDQLSAEEFDQIAKLLPKETAAEAPAETKPLTPEQQKAAIETASDLAAKTLNPFHRVTLEEVQKALYGKSEAEIKAIQEAFKRVGLDLEEQLRKELDGAELGKALELLRHKDADLVPIPEGVDRAAAVKAAEKIHDLAGKAGAGPEIAKELAKMTPDQVKAVVALYKDRYGIDLADDLKDKMPPGTSGEIEKQLPQAREFPDHSRVETVQGKVVEATAADGKGREFKYNEKGELSEVTSTFTGHTWKRTVVDGKEAWVNEKGKVWKGTFNVDADGNLTFTPHGSKTAFLFTREGKTERVPVEALAKFAAPADAAAPAKPGEAPAKPGEAPAKPGEAPAKPGEAPAKPGDAPAKPAEAPAKAVDTGAMEALAKDLYAATWDKVGTDEDAVYKILQGKTKAELEALDAAFKKITNGRGIEEMLKDELSGAELQKALQLLKDASQREPKAADKTGDVEAARKAAEETVAKMDAASVPADAKADVKVSKNADGSETKTYSDNSKVVIAGGKVTEATAADGHTRKFHYNEKGELDQIDGRLGHWEKTVGKDGTVVWKNADTGAQWKGEFTVDADGNLHFKRADGGALVFNRNGETTRVGDASASTGGATGSLERTAATSDKVMTAEDQKAMDAATAGPFFVTITAAVKAEKPDAAKVIQSLNGRTEGEIAAIKEMYKKTHGTELEDDLREKFPGNREIAQAFDKLGTPPEKRVSEARVVEKTKELAVELLNPFGDEEKVTKILKDLSEAEAQAVKARYKQLTGKDLEAALEDRADGLELQKQKHFLNRKDSDIPKVPEGVNRDEILKVNKEIAETIDLPGYDRTAMNKLLAGKTPEQLEAMKALYLDEYGISLDDKFRYGPSNMSFDERVAQANEWKAEKDAAKVSAEAWKLEHNIDFMGGDLEDIREVLAGKTEAEKATLDAAFQKKYGKSIEEYMRAEMEEPELSKALEILKRTDADLVKIPEGVDRAKMREANELIKDLPDMNASKKLPDTYPPQLDPNKLHEIFEGKTKEELYAMNVLFEERYGMTLEAYLNKNSAVPLGSLDAYAREASEAKAARDNLENEVKKVDQAKIAEKAKEFHEATTDKENKRLSIMWANQRPKRGDHPAEQALQDLTPAELEALKRYYKETYGEDIYERAKEVPFYGDSLQRILDRPPYSHISRIPPERRAELREDAEGLWRAMELADGTDEEAIYRILENKTAAERAAIIEYYRELTGDSLERRMISELEEDAGELERGLNYLRIGSDVESANIHEALTDNNAAYAMERISTLPPDQLIAAEKDFEQRYGESLRDAIKNDDGLTDKAKEALLLILESSDRVGPDGKPIIYENGTNRTDEEWVKIAECALHAREGEHGLSIDGPYGAVGDIKLFKSTMAAMPESARKAFAEKFPDTDPYFLDNGDEGDAEEYVKYGRLSTARKISKNDKANDDEAAIEKACDTMPKDERDQYNRGARIYKEMYLDKLTPEQLAIVNARRYGEGVPLNFIVDIPDFDTDQLTEEQKRDYEVFRRQNSAIDGPADGTEARTWRDHSVYSGGAHQAVSDLDNIPLDRKSAPPNYKGMTWEEIRAPGGKEKYIRENNLDLLSPHSQKIFLEGFEKRLLIEKPSDAQYVEGKQMKDVLKLDQTPVVLADGVVHWDVMRPVTTGDREKIVEGISQMSLADQKLYREDSEEGRKFKAQVDERVKLLLDGPQEEAAMRMLDSVSKGGYPVGDYIDQINIEAGKGETSEPKVIRLVEEELRKDNERVEQLKREGKPIEPPPLLERINNPQTEADKALAERLDKALHSALEPDEYEKWAKPLLENGRLTLEETLQLDKEKGNKEDVYKDVQALVMANDAASIEERRRLATDADYREQVLGHLPADQRELVETIIKQSTLVPPEVSSALANAQPDERQQVLERIKTDETYRQQVLGGLSEQDQRVAMRVLEFGPVLPEDEVRAYRIGMQGDKEQMFATLREMNRSAAHEDAFKAAYAHKYHEGVEEDLNGKLDGKDERQMQRLVRDNPDTARELLFQTTEMAEKENSGVGADITGALWSGAGDLAVDSTIQMQALITKEAMQGRELPVDDPQLQALAKNAEEYTEMFITAKEECADMISDVVLGVATIAVPGGWALRALMIVGGGFVKSGIKAAIIGERYEFNAGDFVGGMVDTALSMVDPAKLGKAIGLGRKAATIAAREATEQIGKYALKEGGKRLLKEGGEELLEKEMRTLAAHALVDGTGKISKEAMDKVINKVAAEGLEKAEREVIEKAVAESLEKQLAGAVKSEVRNWIRGKVLEGGVGFIGGAGGGVTRALFNLDPNKSFSENMSMVLETGLMSGAFGAGGAIGFSTAFNIVGKGFSYAGKGYKLLAGKSDDLAGIVHAPHVVAKEGEFAIVRPKDAPAPKVEDAIDVTPNGLEADMRPVGKNPDGSPSHYVDSDGNIYKNMGEGPNGTTRLAPDEHAKIAASEQEIARAERAAAERGPQSMERRGDVDLPEARMKAERSELLKPTHVDKYTEALDKATAGWKDLSGLARKAAESEEAVLKAVNRYEQEVVAALKGKVPDNDLYNMDAMRKHLAGDQQKLAALDDYVKLRKAHADDTKVYQRAIKERQEALQKVMDDVADAQGLPRVKVKVAPDDTFLPGSKGAYQMGGGELKVRASDVLANADRADLADTLYHEFVHSEQDALIIRSIREELQIGKEVSATDMARVQEAYKAKTGNDLDPKHAAEAMKNDAPLSVEQKARAAELAQSVRETPDVNAASKRIGDDSRVVEREIRNLAKGPAAAKDLIDRLSKDNGTLAKHLFGDNMPPQVKKMIANHRQGKALPPNSDEFLDGILQRRSTDLQQEGIGVYQKYRSAAHEQEAWVIGEAAQKSASNRGMGDEFLVGSRGDTGQVASRVDEAPAAPRSRGGEGTRDTAPMEAQKAPGDDAVLDAVPPKRTELNQLERPAVGERPATPELFHAQRDINLMSKAEVDAIKADVRSPFADEANVGTFVDSVLPLTNKWDDTALANVQRLKGDLDFDYARAEKAVLETGKVTPDEFGNPDVVRRKLADNPKELSIYNEFISSQEKYARALKDLEPELQPRLNELQAAMNKFMADRGLPPVKLEVDLSLGATPAGAVFDSGRVIIGHELLQSGRSSDLIENLYHELTHGEQQNFVLNHFAKGRLGHGNGDFTDADVLAIQKQYNDLGDHVSVEQVRNVLENRKALLESGRPVDAYDVARAESLMDAFRQNKPLGEDYARLGQDFGAAEKELARLSDPENPEAWRSLTERLAAETPDGSNLRKQLFGSDPPPAHVQEVLDKWKTNPELVDAQAADVYKDALHQRMNDINDARRKAYDDYMSGVHEKEGWYIGQIAKEQANAAKRAAAGGESGDWADWSDLGVDDFSPVPAGRAGDQISMEPAAAPRDVSDFAPDRVDAPASAAEAPPVGDEAMWIPDTKSGRLSLARRQELRDSLGDRIGEMMDGEMMDSFAGRVLDVKGQFQKDLSGAAADVAGKKEAFHQAYKRYQDEVVSKMPPGSSIDTDNSKVMREYLAHDPEKLQILNEVLARRDEFAKANKSLQGELKQRGQQLQDAFDAFTAQHGLPKVQVKVYDDLGAAGAAYANGTIRVRAADLLNNQRSSEFIGLIYHEMVHNEQDFLVLRSLADEVGIGKQATKEQAAHLKKLYEERTGYPVSDEHMDAVLKARNGEPLDAAQTARAVDLTKAFKDTPNLGKEFSEAGNHFRITKRELDALRAGRPEAAHDLIQKLADDPGPLAKHLFGDSVPPDVQALIDVAKRRGAGENVPWPDVDAGQVLEQKLWGRLKEINNYRKQALADYMSGIHEQEAWLIGDIGRSRAEALERAGRGSTGGVPVERAAGGDVSVHAEAPQEARAMAAVDTTADDLPRDAIVRSEVPGARAGGDLEAGIPRASVATQRPDGLLQGDKIAIGNTRYEVAAYDPVTGDVILRQPGVRGALGPGSEVVRADQLADRLAEKFPGARTLEIDGDTYYLWNGRIYGVHDVIHGHKVIMPENGLTIRPRQELDSAEFISGGEFRRAMIRERAELDLAEARRTDSIPIQSPENTEVLIGNHKVNLENGQITFGRQHTVTEGASVGDMRVSSNHGTLRWDEQQGSFILTDHSTNGTWIKREGSTEFEPVHRGETRVGPNDEIRLGSPDGPQLRLAGTPDASVQAPVQRIDQQVYFGGRPLHLRPGDAITVGRPDMGYGTGDLMSSVVSREHGTLGLDESGRLVYTDHSSNGTYIRRAGSDRFELLREGQQTFINPGDEVRLGSQYGPELKHSAIHGQSLADGSVVFQRAGEDVWQRADGLVQISDRAGSIRIEDQSGNILMVRDATGLDRSYQYLPDGRLSRIDYANGRSLEFRDGEGWLINEPGQPPRRWAGDIDVGPDGSLTYGDGLSPPWRERLDGTTEILHPNGRIEYRGARYDIERAKLDALADYHFHNPAQRARFRDLTQWFEQRARQSGLSQQEVAMTLHHVNRLIQAGDGAPIAAAERIRLAEQILQQSGFPATIDQGFNGTCNVTTVENRIFSRQPSEAARLITDVATTGKYVTVDGALVDLGRVPGGLKPDDESLLSLSRPFDAGMHTDIKMDGKRTYASQIFQNTAVNIKYAKSLDVDVPQTEFVMYEMHPTNRPGDTGERLVRYQANADGSITARDLADNPHVADWELTDIHNKITGRNDMNFVIRGPGFTPAPPGKALEVASAQHLDRVLQWMKDNNQFPGILMVDVGHPPFNRFLNAADAGGSGGIHVVNIQNVFRDANGRMYVEFSNQWGSASNHFGRNAVPVDELFNATRPLPQRSGARR